MGLELEIRKQIDLQFRLFSPKSFSIILAPSLKNWFKKLQIWVFIIYEFLNWLKNSEKANDPNNMP